MRRLFFATTLLFALSLVLTGVVSASTINKSVTPAVNLSSGLVGWWTFDGNDVSATQVLDKAGTNNGTRNGGVNMKAGKIGQAGSFDGSDDNVQLSVGSLQSSITYSGSYTMSAWVFPRTTTVGTIFDIRGAGNSSDRNGIQNRGGYFSGGYWNGAAYIRKGSDVLPLNKWYHVVLTNTAGTVAFYVNGVSQTNTEVALGLNSADKIGANIDQFFNGLIDDARIYSRALSTAEITALYKLGGGKVNVAPANKPNLNSGLVGWWTFDGNDVTSTQVLDKSGKGYNATRAGSVSPVAGKIGQGFGKGFKDSANNYLLVADNDDIEPPTGNFTFSTWAKIASVQASAFTYMISSGAGGGANGWGFSQNGTNGSTNFEVMPAAGTRWIGAFTTKRSFNKWQHFVATVDRSGLMKVYVNGVLADTDNISADADKSIATTNGVYFNGMGYKGDFLVDDTRIYSRILSTAEIQQLYKQGGGKLNVSPANKPNLNSGLVGWWTFDGADAGVSSNIRYALDKSGNGWNTTSTGSTANPVPVGGRIGQGLKFDGSNDALTTVAFTPLASSTNASWSFWAKGTAGGTQTIIEQWTGGQSWLIQFVSGMSFYMKSDSGTPSCNFATLSTVVNLNNWNHFVWKFDGAGALNTDKLNLYVNGVKRTIACAGTIPSAIYNVSSAVRLGGNASNGFYYRSLDDVKIYNRALTQAEVTQLYKMGK